MKLILSRTEGPHIFRNSIHSNAVFQQSNISRVEFNYVATTSNLVLCHFPPSSSSVSRALRLTNTSGLFFLLNLLAPELFFFNFSTPVYKMLIIHEPNTLELWNKLHFEEGKKRRVYTMFKIFSTYICWINIQNVNNTWTK